MKLERLRLEDQVAQVRRDLDELEEQLRDGELDEETAQRLRSTYANELADLEAEVEELSRETEVDRGRSRVRMVLGSAGLLAAIAVVAILANLAVEDRPPGGFVTGGVATDAAFGSGRDLSTVTNDELEQVIAENPDIVPMRLALARRYFSAGEFDKALPHYLEVLDREENPEALANVGWMTYLSNRAELAEPFVERALEIDPGYLPASWFLANIRLYGLDDAAGAVAPLETVLAAPDVPDDVRQEAQLMLDTARGAP